MQNLYNTITFDFVENEIVHLKKHFLQRLQMFISPLTLKNNSFKVQGLQIVLVTTLKNESLH